MRKRLLQRVKKVKMFHTAAEGPLFLGMSLSGSKDNRSLSYGICVLSWLHGS